MKGVTGRRIRVRRQQRKTHPRSVNSKLGNRLKALNGKVQMPMKKRRHGIRADDLRTYPRQNSKIKNQRLPNPGNRVTREARVGRAVIPKTAENLASVL